MPFAHHRWNRGREQLVVEAVEDDREGGGRDQQLLIAGPLTFVEDDADVRGLHAVP